jgi:O-antigen biosynthesis protein
MRRLTAFLRSFGRRSSLAGFVDVVNEQRIAGWVWDEARPESRLTVSIALAGEVIGKTEASLLRPDLVAFGIGDGRHAFDFVFGRILSASATDKITVSVEGTELRVSSDLEVTHRSV